MKCSDYGSKCLNLKRLGAKLAVLLTLSSLLCTSWKQLSHLLLGQTLVSRTKPWLRFQLKKWACVYTIQYMLINKTAQLIVEYLAQTTFRFTPVIFHPLLLVLCARNLVLADHSFKEFQICSETAHFWTFLNIFEHFWTFLNIFEHFWTFLNHFWTFLNIFEHFWTFLNISEHFWTFLNIFEHFWTFFEHFWTFLNIFWVHHWKGNVSETGTLNFFSSFSDLTFISGPASAPISGTKTINNLLSEP